ncbi:hypothetical protein E2C01_068578 [Portunus trituberculatus]|uniref:Uncharacterized protein n=1 Tax=Portunus trituberculatus TaxID=210409 RepID=A0A5B7HWJ1_PORTR|nr:hypothetical protein [Portunus trituberculatus]
MVFRPSLTLNHIPLTYMQ